MRRYHCYQYYSFRDASQVKMETVVMCQHSFASTVATKLQTGWPLPKYPMDLPSVTEAVPQSFWIRTESSSCLVGAQSHQALVKLVRAIVDHCQRHKWAFRELASVREQTRKLRPWSKRSVCWWRLCCNHSRFRLQRIPSLDYFPSLPRMCHGTTRHNRNHKCHSCKRNQYRMN